MINGKQKIKIVLLLIPVFLIFGFGAKFAFAQATGSDVSVNVSPENPGPNENVTLSISTFSVNLDTAQISWTLNGKLSLSGIGRKTFSFKTGDAGNTSTVDVNIDIAGQPTISNRVIIEPEDVDLLWQTTDSYVPPFYEGKALPSSEATIKVVAVANIITPDGTKLASSDLTFSWKKNFEDIPDSSGYADDSYTFKNSYLEDVEKVSVAVSSVTGNYTGEGQTTITPGAPKILFYEQGSAGGTNYTAALTDGFTMQKNPMEITAVPYFFSAPPAGPDLSYKWSINGSAVDTPSPADILTIKSDNGSAGQASITLAVNSLSKIFQSATGSLMFNISQ